MDMNEFSSLLADSDNFPLRRAVERLRDGLFDPFAVRLLTARETRLNTIFAQAVRAVSRNQSPHLCVRGSYGQGKSHSLTYIRECAAEQGFVTSLINLDPREVPFHDFQQVYRALAASIRFPGSSDSLVQYWKNWHREHGRTRKENGIPACIPDSMPHYFTSVLTALVSNNRVLTKKQKGLKKNSTFRPREFPWILANALKGETIPVFRLRHALRYRDVYFYKEYSLVRKGWELYFQAMCGFGEMFQNMGFKGWVLLFDEGESIGQRAINIRRKSYVILDRLFAPAAPLTGLFPIFAFTDDFFMQVENEDYERVYSKNEQEFPYFTKDYGREWKKLNCYHLHDLSSKEWQEMTARLIRLHGRAYSWEPSIQEMSGILKTVLKATDMQDTRLKIKAIVEQLDIAQQAMVLGSFC